MVGVGDLLVGTVGFALLQHWGKRNSEIELHETGGDETVWDVVILDNGLRADVIGTHQLGYARETQSVLENDPSESRASFMSMRNDDEAFNAVERPTSMTSTIDGPHLVLPPEEQHQISDEAIRLYIMQQLPPGSHASVKTDMITARTITVDIFGDDTAEIPAPPGTKVIAERFHNDGERTNFNDSQPPKHTVVFRTAFTRSQNADLIPQVGQDSAIAPVPSQSADSDTTAVPACEELTDDQYHSGANLASNVKRKHHKSSRPRTTAKTNSATPKRLESGRDNRPSAPGPKQSKRSHLRQDTTNPVPQSGPGGHSRSSSESSLASHGKGAWARLAHRVKPGGSEKVEGRKQQNSKRQKLGLTAPKFSHSNHMQTEPTSVNGNIPPRLSSKPTTKQPAPLSPRRVPNGDLAGAPLPNSSRVRSAIPRYIHSRDERSLTPDFFSVREKNRDSFVAQTDSYSFLPADNRPGSSGTARGHVRSNSSMSIRRSGTDMTFSLNNDGRPTSSARPHRRSNSIATLGSESSVILAPRPKSSVDTDTIRALNRDGLVPGIFPEEHFVKNIRRFCRFSSAAYGPKALKMMGVPPTNGPSRPRTSDSHEHTAFSDYAGLPPSSILLSSFVDPEGGTNAAGETCTGFPLVHYLCLDHDSKAVVLALRGTWGFEDILTDMTCDYDDLEWQGKNWKVHKGMHASAKRLLEGGSRRVMVAIRAALDEFPDYGVIFCGHSLGGGVASLLGTMISQPSDDTLGTSFITASHESTLQRKLLLGETENSSQTSYFLPPGRPIHVYAYGPPALMSPHLRRATRGLITTIVNGQDVVPSLSLGILHDLHAVSVAFKGDISGAKSNVRSRFWEGLRESIINKFYVNQAPMLVHAGDGVGEDAWAWKTLKMLREEMYAPKLVPPGEVFVVETIRVLQRDAFTSAPPRDTYPQLGRPATRVQLKFIRSVESWFGELRFGSGMFTDHNPTRYEASITALARGILDC